MIDQLEPKDACQVMHLLKPARHSAHVAEALPDQLTHQKSLHVLVKLADRDFAGLLLNCCLSSITWNVFILIKSKQADMV